MEMHLNIGQLADIEGHYISKKQKNTALWNHCPIYSKDIVEDVNQYCPLYKGSRDKSLSDLDTRPNYPSHVH